LSNVIKAYTVRYEDDAKKTIDMHLKTEKELDIKRSMFLKTPAAKTETGMPEGFVEGLKAVVVEALPSNEEMIEKNSRITEEARTEAKKILDQVKREAEQIKNDAYSAAQKKGYEEGMLQARKEIQKYKTEYDDKARRLQKEYDDMFRLLEPQMAQIIAALVEKITGILVEDKEEVILYLVTKAVKNMEKSDEYTIRVSKEDFEYISLRKNLLLGAIGREVPLYITEDPGLRKNQCLIETELKVINCSLDIQLNNLITDLKLIGRI
jgi:flagellar assembly protein FliH